MTVKRFVDTNILVYAHDKDAGAKRTRALELQRAWWRQPEANAISVQVLQELQVNLIRKGIARSQANAVVRDFLAWPVVENTVELFVAALGAQERWQLSLWDALILAAAQASGAAELVSEDFNDGQNYGGVVARNPFVKT